jgi:hypothetical protein
VLVIRGVTFGENDLIRDVSCGESGHKRGVTFGESDQIRDVSCGENGLIKER